MYHPVGHHLQTQAMNPALEGRRLFARSAYNRYYYDIYTKVRVMLENFDDGWKVKKHSRIPNLLKGEVGRRLQQEKVKASENNDYELRAILENAQTAVVALAEIVRDARGVREAADYEIEEEIIFVENDFSLKEININDVCSWSNKVDNWIAEITRAWRQFDD